MDNNILKSKLKGLATRALALVLAIIMIVPVELAGVVKFNGIEKSYAIGVGNSGSIGPCGSSAQRGVISCDGNNHFGFKLGLVFDENMLVDKDHSVADFVKNNSYSFKVSDCSMLLLPKDYNHPYLKYSTGWYDSGSHQIIFNGCDATKVVMTAGQNSVKSCPYPASNGGIFAGYIAESLKNDEANFCSTGWKDILNQSTNKTAACLYNFEYITGWDNSGYHIKDRINECFGSSYNYDNISTWQNDPNAINNNKAHYLDMLCQLYSICPNADFRASITKAFELILKNQFSSNPFSLSVTPLVGLYQTGVTTGALLISTNDFLMMYLGLNSTYKIDSYNFDDMVRSDPSLSNQLNSKYYEMLKYAANKSYDESPSMQRPSNGGSNLFTVTHGFITYPYINTKYSTFEFNYTDSRNKGRVHQALWLNEDKNGLASQTEASSEVFYGVNYVYYVNSASDKLGIGKLMATPDKYLVNATKSKDKLGKNVDVNISANLSTDAEKSKWDAFLTGLGNTSPVTVTVKSWKRTTDNPDWKDLKANFAVARDGKKSCNYAIKTVRDLKNAVDNNGVIVTDTDLTASYPVTYKDQQYTAKLTYTADLLVSCKDKDGNDKTFTFSSQSDATDDASFIIPTKSSTDAPIRRRYASTPEAFAELKNYGSGSNQTGNLSEDYEAMAGIPTTEQLYYAAGGSEFIVDLSLEYVKDEKATRSYTSYLAGTHCEFYDNDALNDGNVVNLQSCPSNISTSANYQLKAPSTSVCTTYKWDDNCQIKCDHEKGGDWQIQCTYQGDSKCGAETGGEVWHSCPYCGARIEDSHGTLDTSDYDAALTTVNTLASLLSNTEVKWKSTSEGYTHSSGTVHGGKDRSVKWTTSVSSTYDRADHTSRGNNGSCTCTGHHDGCPGHPWSDAEGNSGVNYCSASPCTAGTKCNGSHKWSITMTATIPAHAVCGPCCSHILPDIYDTWSQSWTYDTMKITDVHVWRIDQAAASNLSEVIGPAVDNDVSYSTGAVAGTNGAYNNPNSVNDGTVAASIKSGTPNIFYNIAMKNSNDKSGNTAVKNFTTEDGIGKATESSLVGRVRYNINGNWTDAPQHDEVYYDLGTRTNHCDGMCKTYSTNVSQAGGNGHTEKWADGFLYGSFHAANSTSGTAGNSSVFNSANVGKWFKTAVNKQSGQSAYPLNAMNYLEQHCDGVDSKYATWSGKTASGSTDNVDTNTEEYRKLLEKRKQPIQSTMITDYLILQTSSGDQSVMYFDAKSNPTLAYDKANNKYIDMYNTDGSMKTINYGSSIVSCPVDAETQIPTIEITEDTMWQNNHQSASRWDGSAINIGGYNGQYYDTASKFKGTGDGQQISTTMDCLGGKDPANTIVRPSRPTSRLMLYSLPINIINNTANKSYFTENMKSEVFWTNNLHWSDVTAKSWDVGSNPMTSELYSADATNNGETQFDFANHKDLKTTWGQDNANDANSYKGYIKNTCYAKDIGCEVNGLIIQDPISTSDSVLISLPNERDQRYSKVTDASYINNLVNESQVCPRTAAECEFAVLNCKYGESQKLGEYLFDTDCTNSITKNSVELPAGWTVSGGKLKAKSNVDMIKIPLSTEFNLSYRSGTRLSVNADINIDEIPTYRGSNGAVATRISRMIVGFAGYGLYVSNEGKIGFINSDGQYRESTDVTIEPNKDYAINAIFSYGSIDGCELKVNGETVSFTKSCKDKIVVSSADVGNSFCIGGMQANNYVFNGTIDNLKIERLGGTYHHTDECYTTVMTHPDGLNAHVHNASCIDYGDVYQRPIVERPFSKTFSYNGAMQSITLNPGTYNLQCYGAQGGGTYGGLGGYSSGTLKLDTATTIYIGVGGKGSTFNGGGSGRAGDYGGGATHIAKAPGCLSSLNSNIQSILIVAGGGGGQGPRNGGYGGGANMAGGDGTQGCGYTGHGGTLSSGGYASSDATYGSFGQGGTGGCGGYYTNNGYGGGGGGYYGGGGSRGDYPGWNDYDDSGAGGGSGYANTGLLSNISGSNGTQSGNGLVSITGTERIDMSGASDTTQTVSNFDYTGSTKQITLTPGTYKFECWGAQGGSIYGGKGAYVSGTYTVTDTTTANIYVGGQGSQNNVNSIGAGGFNGGGTAGCTGTTYQYGFAYGGGGASDIRIGGSTLNNRVIVAGAGGGGQDFTSKGYSGQQSLGYGGFAGGSGTAGAGGVWCCGGPGQGASQSAGGAGGTMYSNAQGTGDNGTLGQGGNGHSTSTYEGGAGGGGGYYGGGGAADGCGGASGGGGSSYTGSLTGATLQAGNENFNSPGGVLENGHSGNGYIRITLLSSNASKLPKGYSDIKAAYEAGKLSNDDLRKIFGNAYDLLFSTDLIKEDLKNFTDTNIISDKVNCDVVTYSGSLVSSILGSGPSFVINQNITASEISKIQIILSNNTKAGKAKIYWSNNGSFLEDNSYETNMEANKANQALTFYVSTKPGWNGDLTKFKICIPSEDDVNYGNSVSISEIKFLSSIGTVDEFKYTGGVQAFTPKTSGKYLLETWGASGGNSSASSSAGGKGGYSSGIVSLTKGQPAYVYVGGQGSKATKLGEGGGYNGGGAAGTNGYGGGGMTHISSSSTDNMNPGVTYTKTTTTIYNAGQVWNYAYSGGIQALDLEPGSYKLECWGAQGGGTCGGKGGYSTGCINLNQKTTVYVCTGQLGVSSNSTGAYNGGGVISTGSDYGGGGATHIATCSGLLSSLDYNRSSILVVAGAGGGGTNSLGGVGGGSTGGDGSSNGYGYTAGYGANQSCGGNPGGTIGWVSTAGTFGTGGIGNGNWGGGGGAGYYGGGGGVHWGGGGGSGYTSPTLTSAQTVNGGTVFVSPYGGTETGQSGNGYARITALTNITKETISMVVNPVANFDTSKLFIAAGGGGGSDSEDTPNGSGGYGGGLTGGNAYVNGTQINRGFYDSCKKTTLPTGNVNGSPSPSTPYCWYQTNSGCGCYNQYWYSASGSSYPSESGHQSCSGWVRQAQFDYGGTNGYSSDSGCGSGGTQSQGYRHGLGESATYDTDTGGAGGGWYGGYITNNSEGGAGGGSGYIDNVTSYTVNGKAYNKQTISGNSSMPNISSTGTMTGNNGNGFARITLVDAGAADNFPSIDKILEVADKMPEDSSMFVCDHKLNTHICNENCVEVKVLNCCEPHHTGGHYDHDDLCYDACCDDSKHKTNKTINTANGSFTPGNFINIDWGFQIYYGNKGDFYQSDINGIGQLTNTRGIGYKNDEDVFKWTRTKQVKYSYNVIYKDKLYLAGEWITLGDKGDYLGVPGSPYDEKNWSNYNTDIYNALNGDNGKDYIYNFYCVEANSEASSATVSLHSFGINNVNRIEDCGNENGFSTYVTNRPRLGALNMAVHSAFNQFHIDVVGRIGNLAVLDSGDYRFSNLFKKSKDSSVNIPDPVCYDSNSSGVEAINSATKTTDGIQASTAGGGAKISNLDLKQGTYKIYVKGSGLLNSSISVKSKSNWKALSQFTPDKGLNVDTKEEVTTTEGIDYKTVTSTVSGPGIALDSGEYNIVLNGENLVNTKFDLTDDNESLLGYVENKNQSDSNIIWNLKIPKDVKNFNIRTVYVNDEPLKLNSLTIYKLDSKSSCELANTDKVSNSSVTDDYRSYTVVVDADTSVDLSIYTIGLPITVKSISTQKIADKDTSWTVEGIVKNVDSTEQNNYLTWTKDIRGLTVDASTKYIDTYGTQGWAQTANCITNLPLDASKNNIEVLKNNASLVGYDTYLSISSIGNYYKNGSGFLQIIPEYYSVDTKTGELYPVDVYIAYNNTYYPINIWGLITGDDKLTWGDKGSQQTLSSIYNFATKLNWDEESGRRMVTPSESYMTSYLKEYLKNTKDDGSIEYLNTPFGSSYIEGNTQFLQLNGKGRTFIGGEATYGELMNYSPDGKNSSTMKTNNENGVYGNPDGRIDDPQWWQETQRWHFKLGLPSSAVFVRAGDQPTVENINKLNSNKYAILCTADIRLLGEYWNLRYTQANGNMSVLDDSGQAHDYKVPDTITVGGKVHEIPSAITVYQTTNNPVDISIVGNH